MKPWLVGGATLYTTLIVFCAFGVGAIPASIQEAVLPYFWLLGPPANLVHGTHFLWPFVIGTIAVVGFTFGVTRSESPGVQIVCAIALLLAWALFGFIVYAPGA